MNKVINLKDHLEEWNCIFSLEDSCFYVSVSNHGRVSVRTQHDKVVLDLVSSSNLILSLQNGIDAVCDVSDSD